MSHSFLFNIFIRICLIVLTAFALGWSVFSGQLIILDIVLTIVLFILIRHLLRFQNRVNERINYFFEAIRNEDFSLAFPTKKNDRIIQELNRNLFRVNQYIQQIKIETHQQEQYFRALIEHVGIGIFTYNEKGFVLHANSCLKNLVGLRQFTHLKQLETIDPKLVTTLKQIHPPDQRIISFTSKQGTINLLVKANAFISNNEQLMLLSAQDINQELDEKELDSWLKLIRVLTHEIMNSIAPVTSLSDSLSRYFLKNGVPIKAEEVNESMIKNTIRGLEVISEQGKGLISFVESYRQLTRLPKPDKKIIPLKDFLEKTALLCQSNLKNANIQFSVKLSTPDMQLLADEKLIAQVLINLIKNAGEALTEVKTGEIVLQASQNENSQPEISVTDNGPGIPPELINEIFVPFFSTRDHGSGIGLSLSRQIMRLHGGSLKVQSIPNKETTFTLKFS